MKKKAVSLAIAMVLGLSLMGCGGEQSQEKSSEAVSEAKVSEEASTVEEPTGNGLDWTTIDYLSYDDGIDVSGIPTKYLDSCFVAGDAAYEYYGFVEDYANGYVANVKKAASIAKDATVYSILAPTSMDVTLPLAIRKTIDQTSDQEKAINYMYEKIGQDAVCVPIIYNLRAHRDEYLYFRTDHHWTELGAYYAYQEFCKAKGIKANSLSSYKSKTFDRFLGTFYQFNEEADVAALLENPDKVTVYYPKSTNDMKMTDENGNVCDWDIISDASDWQAGTKYNTFIAGDQPFCEIDNPDISDGTACVCIKESVGNAFVPLLVDHYDKVYVIDYRHYKGTLSSFLNQYKVNDVIFMNYLGAAISDINVTNMQNFVQ